MVNASCFFLALVLGQPESAPTPAADDAKWLLMRTLQTLPIGSRLDQQRIGISGWTDLSFTASSAGRGDVPIGFNNRGNDFLLQQNWLRIERAILPDAPTPSFGFRADTILPGSDYRFTVARGLFSGQLSGNNGGPHLYGIDPIQFYAEAYFPNVGKGLDVKFGRIFCQYGVEANDAPGNALFSHAYTFIYDPFTHTGVMGTLKLSDQWSVQAGMMLGNDVFIDPAAEPTGMGSVKWVSADGNDSVLFSVILGSGRFNRARNFHNPQIFDLVAVHKFNPKLTYTFEGLYGFTTDVPDFETAQWFGILNYLTCEFTPKVSGTTRLEFFDDLDGQRTGFRGLYTAVTIGLTLKPHRAIVLRPEIRYDVNSDSRPFNNRRGLFTAGCDLILRW